MRKPILAEDMFGLHFSEREKRVFSLFWKAGFNRDVLIDDLFKKYIGWKPKVEIPEDYPDKPRQRQMAIGMVVTRINRKLRGTKIVPGALKRTYRITHID